MKVIPMMARLVHKPTDPNVQYTNNVSDLDDYREKRLLARAYSLTQVEKEAFEACIRKTK